MRTKAQRRHEPVERNSPVHVVRPPPEVVAERRRERRAKQKAKVIGGLWYVSVPYSGLHPLWCNGLITHNVPHRLKLGGIKVPIAHYRLIDAFRRRFSSMGLFSWGKPMDLERSSRIVNALCFLPKVLTQGELARLLTQLQLCNTEDDFADILIAEAELRGQS